MIRAPSLVEALKNTEPPSARSDPSEDESRSNKSHTLLARVVSSGNSSSVGSQSLNSARLLASVLSPREDEDSPPATKATPVRSNLETLAEEREGGGYSTPEEEVEGDCQVE